MSMTTQFHVVKIKNGDKSSLRCQTIL